MKCTMRMHYIIFDNQKTLLGYLIGKVRHRILDRANKEPHFWNMQLMSSTQASFFNEFKPRLQLIF